MTKIKQLRYKDKDKMIKIKRQKDKNKMTKIKRQKDKWIREENIEKQINIKREIWVPRTFPEWNNPERKNPESGLT